ncbi:MAG TPA: DUF502 domain-containing protein [Gammaproteobacteria bacterium]|nr:DUF502 domain-containing protein [Gammaproteobacteria bacterium]
MMSQLRRYFISGLLVWLPVWITILAIKFLVDILSYTLLLLPKQYQPDALIGFHIPGIGVVITLLVILSTGILVTNLLGKQLVAAGDALIARIPIVRTIYTSVKQIVQTVFRPNGQSFRQVFLVEYPRAGVWTIAFQTGETSAEIFQKLNGEPLVSLYVPTTPNPTSGFLLLVPRKDVIELEMSVDQALKFVISLGVVQPANHVIETVEVKGA